MTDNLSHSETLKNYSNSVEYLAKNKVDFIFKNSDAEHAGIVLCNIIKYAIKEVRMYLSNLDGSIIDKNKHIINYITRFLNNDGKLIVVVESEEKYDSDIYKFLKEECKINTNLKVKCSNAAFQSGVQPLFKKKPSFFITGDDYSYRISGDDTTRAVCNFNDKKSVQKINLKFDSSLQKADDFCFS